MYARDIGGEVRTFGVSGLLYKSNVLMYDHQSESLWSQILRRAVTGPMTGTRLKPYPSALTTWKKWRKSYPETTVVTFDTGHRRDYSEDPYADYYESRRSIFSLFKPGPGEEEKELVVGVEAGGVAKAYPLSVVRSRGTISDGVGGARVEITFDRESDRISATADGAQIVPVVVYWFVWKGSHPATARFGGD